MSFQEIITINLDALSKSTHVSPELVNLIREKNLLGVPDQETLSSEQGTNYAKATLLYSRGAQTWTNSQFQEFLSVLKRSGNERALEIISSSRSAVGKDSDAGSFEGYMLDDELEANQIQRNNNASSKLKRVFNRSLFKCKKTSKTLRKGRLDQQVSSGKVWWNPCKPQLPPDYIERRVFQRNRSGCHKETTLLDLVVPNSADPDDWTNWKEEQVLILLVDSPGMGKSCALTRLEQELREKLDKSPRVIVRINLNTVGSGVGESAVENRVENVIRKLFVPLKDISSGGTDSLVYVLLDGLDEVLPQNQESVLSVIRFLLSESAVQKGWVVEKVVLTTRPHLKEMIETKFNVKAYFLVPLTKEEQVNFIEKRTGRKDARELISDLSYSMQGLISNPLMLSMYCSVLVPGKQSNSFDQYEIYVKFMVKKHELYASEKIGRSFVPHRVLKQMLFRNEPFYNCVAIREILGEDELGIVVDLAKNAGKAELIQKAASPVKQNELISFGVVVKDGEKLKFVHRSFAEFFYVQLMTDVENTPKDVRNVLFAMGYDLRNNVATFVSCVVGKDKEKVQFVSSGWTKFVPKGEKLERYVERDGILFDHIISSTIEYEGNCRGKNELLARDIWVGGSFLLWLSDNNDMWIRNFLLHENNTRILAAFVFTAKKFHFLSDDTMKFLALRELCKNVLFERMAWMPLTEREVVALDVLTDIWCYHDNIHPLIFAFLASAVSKEKLYHLIVNEDTRVTDLIAYTKLRNARTCLGNEFIPKRLLKFRYKFGRNKGKSLFQREFPQDMMNRVWEEIEQNVQDAVQIVLYDKDFGFIKLMENNLRGFEGECAVGRLRSNDIELYYYFPGSSELRESRRKLLIDVLATVDWENVYVSRTGMEHLYDCLVYAKMELAKWEQFTRNEEIFASYTDNFHPILACLMLSAFDEERVKLQQHAASSLLVRAPFDLVRKLVREAHVDRHMQNLWSFIKDLSREEWLGLATIKTKDPVLVSDLPNFWELLFHADKGLAKVKRQKALTVLNKRSVFANIIESQLQSTDGISQFLEMELRRVFESERSLGAEELVKKAIMTDIRVLRTFARRVRALWLEDVNVGKKYTTVVVDLQFEIFKGELGDWTDWLVDNAPVQLLVVAEEKVLSGGEQKWVKLLKSVKLFMRDHFQDTLSINNMRDSKWEDVRCNRECDWYTFFVVVLNESEEMRNEVPVDYANRTKVYPTWSCSLLRVWIQLFGEEETRRQADEISKVGCFWEWASEEMKDGELLHIAVEIGSVIGVKWTAWPTTISWRDVNNRSAVELADKKFESDHEVTKYLRRFGDNLTEYGFLAADKEEGQCL